MATALYKIMSKITDVTVYLSGAQITRQAIFTPAASITELVFENLTHTLQPGSLQVSAGEGITILSVEHRINYLKESDKSADIEVMQQELESLEDQLTEQNSQLELCALEESFFAANNSLAGNDIGLKASELKEAVLFYNERMANIAQKRIICNKEIQQLKKRISVIQFQLGSFQNTQQFPVSEVVVKAATENLESANLTISYYVSSASWLPAYDIRAKDTASPVLLHYKAQVSQNTGEDWEDVQLVLSTGNPSSGSECPEVKPWYIDFYAPPVIRDSLTASMPAYEPSRKRNSMLQNEVECIEELSVIDESIIPEPAARVSESLASVEYIIKQPYSIASGDGGQSVEIITHSLPARYHHFSARKLEKEVFLLAVVKDWEGLNLVAGEAAIFFENRYVGKTFIDPRRAGEEISLSLGVDQSVIVTRVRGKDFTEKSLTGSSVKQTRQWELTVRNLKSVAIDIKVVDQIPVSLNKQITVDAVDISKAQYDKDTGILTWTFELEPAAVRKMVVKYLVTHPKKTTVVLE